MGYFSQDDIQALCGDNSRLKSEIQARFLTIHKKVFEQLHINDIELNIIKPSEKAVHADTVSRHKNKNDDKVLSVQYMRSRSQAVTIERLMGREEIASANNLIVRLHPVIEVRLSENGLTVELIISPDAWWDQENLKGKLSISRHRYEFYTLLMTLEDAYIMGFWEGVHQSDMHLAGKYFQHPRILDEWLSTFNTNSDWFRLGVWYALDDEALAEDQITATIVEQVRALYPVYLYFLWTSGNNYREFNNT
ncbi:MAG: hypothetical protein WBC91_01210 [Phototrophicaceae bacterium]